MALVVASDVEQLGSKMFENPGSLGSVEPTPVPVPDSHPGKLTEGFVHYP